MLEFLFSGRGDEETACIAIFNSDRHMEKVIRVRVGLRVPGPGPAPAPCCLRFCCDKIKNEPTVARITGGILRTFRTKTLFRCPACPASCQIMALLAESSLAQGCTSLRANNRVLIWQERTTCPPARIDSSIAFWPSVSTPSAVVLSFTSSPAIFLLSFHFIFVAQDESSTTFNFQFAVGFSPPDSQSTSIHLHPVPKADPETTNN